MKNNIITVNQPGSLAVTISLETDDSVEAILEHVFGLFNHGSGTEHPKFIELRMRSLSVNDFVCVNGQWYQCLSVGWEKCSEQFVDKIEADVVNHPLYKEHGEWFALSEVMYDYRKSISK